MLTSKISKRNTLFQVKAIYNEMMVMVLYTQI